MAHRLAAHRGGSGLHPENTLGAFRTAHARFPGIWLEMDVRLSADGELIVIHDYTLDRTTSGTGLVAERTADEITTHDAASHWPDWGFEPVPTLRTVLREGLGAGWRILCEIKNTPGQPDFDATGAQAARSLAGVLTDVAFPSDRFEVISFWPPTLDAVKAAVADLRVGLISAPPEPPRPGLGATDNLRLCIDRGYEITAPEHATPDLDGAVITAARQAGIDVYLWTVNEPPDIARAISLGVTCIISDHPDLVG